MGSGWGTTGEILHFAREYFWIFFRSCFSEKIKKSIEKTMGKTIVKNTGETNANTKGQKQCKKHEN